MQRPRYHSAMARRVFIVVILCLLVLLAGLAALAYLAFLLAADALAALPLANRTTEAIAALWLDQAAVLWPYALAALTFALLAALLLARWAARPLDRLVLVATTFAADARASGSVQSPSDVGQLARNFSELSDMLLRSSHELEKQNKLMANSVSRLEHLLKVGNELSVVLDTDELLVRAATAIRETLGYERVAAALIEGETLAFYVGNSAPGRENAPLHAALAENTVAGRAALTGQVVRSDDLRLTMALGAAPLLASARSELAVPVIHNRQVLAVLVLQSATAAAFELSDEEQIGILAQMLAGALANSTRFRDEQLRRQMAEAIYRVSQTLNGALALDRVPELILDQLAQVLPFDRSALLFINGTHVETIATRGSTGQSVLLRGSVPIVELPLIAEIVQQACAIVVDDAASDSRYRPISGDAPAQSWLGAPLVRLGHAIGVLVLESDQPQRYGRDELAAMTAIANQAVIALENARLYTEAQDRAQRLEVITELTTLLSTRDVLRELHGILRTAIHRIRRVVPCDYAALAVYNLDDDTFTVEPVYDFAVRDWADLPAGQRVAAEGTPWQAACRTGAPVVASDLAANAFAENRQLATNGLHSGVIVPILGANQPVGTLTFASRDGSAYRQTQISTLVELAHHLGPALYNARLNRERDAATSQLAQTQEYLNLVDKVRVVGQLASGVAHDFNNLLAGILGNAQLLLYEIQEPDQREMLRVIERAAKDGSETVRRLQGFARMEHDSPMTEVRLDMLARDAIDITRPRWRDVAQSRGVSIEIVRELDPVTPIAGRPAELREVLTNLIINAVDALPKGGQITLTSYDAPGPDGQASVVLEVSDNGVGMPLEVQARIFDPFFTTKGEQGTGLGLAVSLGIIQSHGGQIEVKSAAGAGTRFLLRLPVRMPTQAAPREEVQAAIIPGHLLLIESDPMIRESLVRLLVRWGHRVTQANGGIEALHMFQPDMFDLVISDLGMPDMSGWELLEQVKQRDARVPTVLLTGWGRSGSDDEMRARGVDFMIEKPFDQDDLRRVLAQAMGARPLG